METSDLGKLNTSGRWTRDLVALMSLALAYRLAFLWAMPRVIDTADAIHYIDAAKCWAAGAPLTADPKIPLLYPALSALLFRLLGDWEHACMAVSLLASVLAVAPLYALARALHGRPAAGLAGVLLALWPWMADYGCRVGNEALALCCWLGGVWALSWAWPRGGWRVALAVLPFFALHLTRAEGFVVWGSAMLLALFLDPKHASRGRNLAVFCTISLFFAFLSGVWVRAATGQTTANYRIGFIVQEFDLLRFGDTALKSVNEVLPVMLGPVLLIFLGVGLFRTRMHSDVHGPGRDWRLEFFVLGCAAAQLTASWFVLSPAPRYLMAPIAVLATWSATGAVTVARQTPVRALRWVPAAVLVLWMLSGTAVTLASEHLGRAPREPREYKIAGEWMRANLPPGLIFTRKPQIAFYADMPSTGPLDTDSLEAALARAQAAGAQYVVVDERYAIAALRPLLDEAQSLPPALESLYRAEPYPHCRIAVFRLVPQR